MWGLQSIAEEIYNLFWILNFCQPVRVSTDKWARVSWLLCCVPPLSGIFGIDPNFSIPLQNIPKRNGSTFFPSSVGWLLRKCCVHPLSLGSLGLTLRKKWEAQFCRPELVSCYVMAKLWYPNMETWTIQVQICQSFGCYDVSFLHLARLTIPFHG